MRPITVLRIIWCVTHGSTALSRRTVMRALIGLPLLLLGLGCQGARPCVPPCCPVEACPTPPPCAAAPSPPTTVTCPPTKVEVRPPREIHVKAPPQKVIVNAPAAVVPQVAAAQAMPA